MICTEPKFPIDIHLFTTLFNVILRCKLSRLNGFANCKMDLDLSIHDFAFFKHCFMFNNRPLQRKPYLLLSSMIIEK